MERTLIKEINSEQEVTISGFVENIRNKKFMAFIVLKDISGKIQVTVEKEKDEELANITNQITLGSVISVTGKVTKNDYVKLGGIEVLADKIEILSKAEALPIHSDASIDLRIDYRWLDLRTDKNTLMFKVQTCLLNALKNFVLDRDFIEIHSPKTIGTASESGSEVFEVKYFDTKAYLSQSPQFYKQMAMASGFEKVVEVGPVFRAEKSFTSKHTTEFTGFDIEFSYINSYVDVMKFEQELIKYALQEVKNKYGEEIKELFDCEVVVPTGDFPIMKLSDVYAELKKRYNYDVPAGEEGDLTTEAEKLCKNLSMEMFNSEFLFITDYASDKRAFYHMRKDGIPQGYDLIWKGVEITTGAQREHRYDILCKQAEEKGLKDDVKFYLEFFKYGCPPHGGFGLGLDRLTMILLNTTIKEVMFIFRGPNRITP